LFDNIPCPQSHEYSTPIKDKAHTVVCEMYISVQALCLVFLPSTEPPREPSEQRRKIRANSRKSTAAKYNTTTTDPQNHHDSATWQSEGGKDTAWPLCAGFVAGKVCGVVQKRGGTGLRLDGPVGHNLQPRNGPVPTPVLIRFTRARRRIRPNFVRVRRLDAVWPVHVNVKTKDQALSQNGCLHEAAHERHERHERQTSDTRATDERHTSDNPFSRPSWAPKLWENASQAKLRFRFFLKKS